MATLATIMSIVTIALIIGVSGTGILVLLDNRFCWFGERCHRVLCMVFWFGLLVFAVAAAAAATLSDTYLPQKYVIVRTVSGQEFKVAQFYRAEKITSSYGYVDGKKVYFPDIRSYENSEETYVWEEYRQVYGM